MTEDEAKQVVLTRSRNGMVLASSARHQNRGGPKEGSVLGCSREIVKEQRSNTEEMMRL